MLNLEIKNLAKSMPSIKKMSYLQPPQPQQADDAKQMAVIEEDPSPLDTDESNEENLTQADHTQVAAGSVKKQRL